MALKNIFCQDKAINILNKAFASKRMAQSYIFAGADGIGKEKTAKAWAKVLLCQNRTENTDQYDSCDTCKSCQLFDANSHPDFQLVYKELIEFTKDGKGRKTPVFLPIDVVRQFLLEKAFARPTLSKSRVFIITEAEKLNTAAQNCLLKILEEPPANCYIILICNRLEKLLPTVKSRCQAINFGPIDAEHIITRLKELGLNDNQSSYWARLSDGSLGSACQWANLELNDADCFAAKTELVNSLVELQLPKAVKLAERLGQMSKSISSVWADLEENTSKTDINRRVQKQLVKMIIAVFSDIIKINVGLDTELINTDQKSQIDKLAERIDAESAAEFIEKAYKTMRWIDSSVNEKLIFEELLLNLVKYDNIRV